MLINITGIDGCGKGTQIQHLIDYLEKRDKKVFLSKAYGPREKETFSLFIERSHDLAVMFMFQAFHVQQRVRAEKALNEGLIVIADRWDDAYLAYHSQNGILSKDRTLLNKLNVIAFNKIKPDITFLLNVPVDVCKERIQLRGADFFDRKGEQYHQQLSNRLNKLAKECGWKIINGNQPDRIIHEEIVSIVESMVK